MNKDGEIAKALLINYEYFLYEAVENEKVLNYLLFKIKTLTKKQRENFLYSPENFSTFLFSEVNSSTIYTKMVLEKYPDIAKRTLFFLSLENEITDLERLSKSIYKYHDVYNEEGFGPYAMEFFYPSTEEDFKIIDFYYEIYKTFDEETAINLIYMNQEDIEKLVKRENIPIEKLKSKLYSLQRLTKTEMEEIYPYTDILFRILLWDNGVEILIKSPYITKELYEYYSKNEQVINSFRYTIEDLGFSAVYFYSQNRGNLGLVELMEETDYHEEYGGTYLISKILNDLIIHQNSNGTKLMNDKILFYLNAPIKQIFTEKYSSNSLTILDFVPGYDLFNLIYKASDGYVLDSWDYIGAGFDIADIALTIFTLGGSKFFSTSMKQASNQILKNSIKEGSEEIIEKTIKKAPDLLPLLKKVISSKFIISSKGQIASYYRTIKNIGKIDVTNFFEICFKTSKKLSSKFKFLKPVQKKIFLSGGKFDARSIMRNGLEIKFSASGFLVDETMMPFMIGKSIELNDYLVTNIVIKGVNTWD